MTTATKILFTAFLSLAFGLTAHAAPGKAQPKPREVLTLEKSFKDLGIAGARTEGLSALANAKPEIRPLLEQVAARLKKNTAVESFKTNKAQFESLIEKIDAASIQAAEVIANGGPKSATASKVLELIEALPSVLAEVANGGPNADVQKATDIATILANLNNRVMETEGNPADIATGVMNGTAERPANLVDVVILVNQRLGTDKSGKKVTIEDLIKRCLDAARQGKA